MDCPFQNHSIAIPYPIEMIKYRIIIAAVIRSGLIIDKIEKSVPTAVDKAEIKSTSSKRAKHLITGLATGSEKLTPSGV